MNTTQPTVDADSTDKAKREQQPSNEASRKLAIAREALAGVLNSALHPDIAIRALMVPLAPVRAALAELDK